MFWTHKRNCVCRFSSKLYNLFESLTCKLQLGCWIWTGSEGSSSSAPVCFIRTSYQAVKQCRTLPSSTPLRYWNYTSLRPTTSVTSPNLQSMIGQLCRGENVSSVSLASSLFLCYFFHFCANTWVQWLPRETVWKYALIFPLLHNNITSHLSPFRSNPFGSGRNSFGLNCGRTTCDRSYFFFKHHWNLDHRLTQTVLCSF